MKYFTEPFFGITTSIDMTICVTKRRNHENSVFVYYLQNDCCNKPKTMENFRYRIEENEVVIYDEIDAFATIIIHKIKHLVFRL